MRYLILSPLVLLTALAFSQLPYARQETYTSQNFQPNGETNKDNSSDGITKQYYPDGKIMSIGGYLSGKPEGGFRKFLPNGQIVLFSNYKNGILEGENPEYYDNGEIKTIKNYKTGQLEGLVKEYDQNGRLKRQIYYHKNKPIQNQRNNKEEFH